MKYFAAFVILFAGSLNAQYNDRNFSIGLSAVYTTSAKLFLNPNSPVVIERNASFDFEDIYNAALNFRYKLISDLFLDLNTEYMKKTAYGKNERVFMDGGIRFIEVEDGFKLIPFELSLYYLLPFSTERFKFLMGGGGAFYFGSQIRKFGNAEVSTVKRKTAYGIQVAIEMDYLIKENISINAQMKFRDPQFTIRNQYSKAEYILNGQTVQILENEFDTKINVDGISFVLGIAYHF